MVWSRTQHNADIVLSEVAAGYRLSWWRWRRSRLGLSRAAQIRLTLFISALTYFYLFFGDGETASSLGTKEASGAAGVPHSWLAGEGEGGHALLFTTPH